MHIKQLAPNEEDKESSMFEIFDRLNTGGSNLSDQEIRMNIYYSDFYKMIDELNIDIKWRKLLDKEELDLRFKDFEILLRCIAIANDFPNYKSAMKTFLNSYSHKAKFFKKDEIKKRVKGAVTKTIRKDAIREIPIIVPTIEFQNQFAERVAVIEAQKQQAQLELAKSEELFQSLLQRAFKGELS